ncbi:MAG: sensor histidine kinase [Oscillospiraceae bacterium]|nr:sensor histidine kinase [Oscillospiraceae bacterium]
MLFSYLRRHYKVAMLFLVFALVFAAVLSLYALEAEAVLYAALLCFCLGLAAFGFGLRRYIARHKALRALMPNIELGLDGLPEPNGAIEADYQELLRLLYAQSLAVRSESDGARRDMADYYTLWAHQIKTPLAAMRLLLAENGGPNAGLLQGELLKTEQYVDMVLQYVRLSGDVSDLLLRRCDLDPVIRGSLRKFARLFALKKLDFSFTETGLTVLTDEKWLAFVIEQLFSNALKYTDSGKISIYAEGETLVISDTGIGIRPEDLPRVCEKGYTGTGGRADKKATGIGLFLCKKVLTKLGHSLELSSKVGVGTTVKIGLARSEARFE